MTKKRSKTNSDFPETMTSKIKFEQDSHSRERNGEKGIEYRQKHSNCGSLARARESKLQLHRPCPAICFFTAHMLRTVLYFFNG